MIREGSRVEWSWGNGKAQGEVEATWSESVTKTIKGNEVTRDGQPGNKALLIKQDDGDRVLKLASEVKKA